MSKAEAPGRRLRIGASTAAVVLGVLTIGAIAAPLLQQSRIDSSTTVLHDGSSAAPGLGAVGELPPADGAELVDPGPVAVAAGIAARSDGSAVLLTRFAGAARTDSSLALDGEVLGLALSPAGDLLAVVDASGSLSLFTIGATAARAGASADLDVGEAVRVEVATSSDGSSVAVTAVGDDRVRLLDRASGEVHDVHVGLPIAALAPGPASTVHALTETAIVVLDAASASVVRAVATSTEGRAGLALVDRGASVAVWDEARLLLLEARTLDAAASYAPAGPVFAVADGAAEGTIMVAIGGSAPRIALVDLESRLTLSELASDVASFAAIAAAGAPGSLLLATPWGIAVGSWEASRVPWQAWWTSAAACALLAVASAIVALRAGRSGARGEPAMTGAMAGPAWPVAPEDPWAAGAPPPHGDHLHAERARPAAVSGSVHNRMRALRFAVVTPTTAERVLAVVEAEADGAGTDSTSISLDDVVDGTTATGSVRSMGVRMATFVVSLAPTRDGGTHTRFHVDWYRTAPAMVPFTPGDHEESPGYGPLRDFAVTLADSLERVQP